MTVQCDTLIEAGWCLPVDRDNSVLKDHAIAIQDGRLIDLLPVAEARQKYDPGALIRRESHVVLPGFVNVHCHAAMTLFRGFGDDLPLESWLRDRIWPAEGRWVSAEMVRDGTRHAIAEMLRGGVTCFSDQYFFPEIVADTAADMAIRAVVATPVIDFETAWAKNGAECLSKAADLVHDAYADHPLITTAFAPHSTDVVSDETFQALRVLADQLDRGIQIHLHETSVEVDNALRSTGMRPFERLNKLGLVNASLLAVHGVHLSPEEHAAMAEKNVSLAHCPRSNQKLASGVAPIAEIKAAGVNVGLGTDGAASNNVLDMLGELRSAALLAKATTLDAEAMDARQTLRMATLDGARALGLDDETGSLAVGKWADIACIDLDRLHSQPVYDPASQVVYTCEREQVTDVWVAGRHVLDQGRLTGCDEAGIIRRSREWQARIAGSNSIPDT